MNGYPLVTSKTLWKPENSLKTNTRAQYSREAFFASKKLKKLTKIECCGVQGVHISTWMSQRTFVSACTASRSCSPHGSFACLLLQLLLPLLLLLLLLSPLKASLCRRS